MAEPPEIVDLLVENHRQFRAFLASRVGNDADADDILQSAFLKAVDKGDSIRSEERVVAWFYRLLRNALTDHHRHRAAEGRALTRFAGREIPTEPPESDIEKAVCQCVLALLPTLREDYADLLQRVDLEGQPIGQVAARTGLTRNHARVKLFRARRALREQLAKSCGSCTEHGCLDCTCKHDSHHTH